MAGIGFELKKLFKQKGYILNTRAYMYSTIVIAGPLLLCTTLIILTQSIIKYFGVSYLERELYISSVVYCFIFSQILTSGFSMIITRYVSDQLYMKSFDKIPSSLYGVSTICVVLSGVVGVLFFCFSPLQAMFKLISYTLFLLLTIMWIQSVYLTALKDYIKIVAAYFIGSATSLILSIVFLLYLKESSSISIILSMDIGIFIIVLCQMSFLNSYFRECNINYFEFTTYFKKYPQLFFINLFYALGLYAHNFIFWSSSLKSTVANTYYFAPLYDVPVFYAFLTIVPCMVIFVVSIETSFYDRYKEYYSLIIHGGSLMDIKRAKQDMKNVLFSELRHMMEVQFFFSLIFIIMGYLYLPKIGIIGLSLDIYTTLVLAAFCNVVMLISILLLLYFEDRKGALYTAIIFFLSTSSLTYVTLFLGENTYGFGFFIGAFISLIFGIIRLVIFIRDIDYHTFCSQPISNS